MNGMADMADTRNDNETVVSGFSGSKVTSSLRRSLPDFESDIEESLFGESAGGGSEASKSLEWSSSGDESFSVGSSSRGSTMSSERWEVVDVF
jgi:hypothetical protein